MIKKYEESLLQKGRRHNTISTYMRMLRSIFNQAYQQGVPDTIPSDELFRFVFTGYEPTAKRAISPALIRRLSQLNLEQSPNLRFSRDLFLLSFYLRGIPFVDLAHLRKSDMKHNTIYYCGVEMNRKMLAEMAVNDAEGFAKLVDVAKEKLA